MKWFGKIQRLVFTPLKMLSLICHQRMNEPLQPLRPAEVCSAEKHHSWTSSFGLVAQWILLAIHLNVVQMVCLCQIQHPHPRRQLQ